MQECPATSWSIVTTALPWKFSIHAGHRVPYRAIVRSPKTPMRNCTSNHCIWKRMSWQS
jgi:hypothetical protein